MKLGAQEDSMITFKTGANGGERPLSQLMN